MDAAGLRGESRPVFRLCEIHLPDPSAAGRATSINFFATNNDRQYVEPNVDVPTMPAATIGVEYQKLINLGNAGSLLGGTRVRGPDARRAPGAALPVRPSTVPLLLYAGYLLYQLPVGERLNLSFAGRYDGAVDGEGFTTGRATANYALPELEAAIRGSIGTGAKRPTAFQLSYNPDLQAETSVGGDLGIDKSLFDGRLTVSVTGFWNHIDQMIDWDFTLPPWGNYANIDKVRTSGVEVGAKATIVSGVLYSTATYTYLDARNLTTDMPLARRARNSGSLSVVYTGIRNLERHRYDLCRPALR